MGPRAGRPPPGFNPWTVQPVASRYTDYATRPTIPIICVKIWPPAFVVPEDVIIPCSHVIKVNVVRLVSIN